jgi:Glycosyltransferase 61
MYELHGSSVPDPDSELRSVHTHHGSIVFLDPATGELRHGGPDLVARNVFMAIRDGQGHLLHVALDAKRFGIRVLPEQAAAVGTADPAHSEAATAAFRLIETAAGPGSEFGLQNGGLLLCAEVDGRMTLSRSVLGPWERFRLAELPAPDALPPVHQETVERAARFAPRYPRQLPVEFFPQGKVGLDARGVPFVVGTPIDVVSTRYSEMLQGSGLTIVVRDPQYIAHYFHFMEILIGLFAFQMQYLGHLNVERIIFGTQEWNNPAQNEVQMNLVRAVYGDVEILDGASYLDGVPSFANVLCIDRDRAVTRINKFLEQLVPEARIWTPELRRRVHRATQAPVRQAAKPARTIRFSYIHRKPVRTLTEPVRARLFEIAREHFDVVGEIDFASISWQEQVKHVAQLDVLVGVHGNGLTNLLWLPPHAVVIEIFQRGLHTYDYQMMAEVAGITYFGIEGAEQGHIYREWNRLHRPDGDINRSVDYLPEAALHNIFDIIEDRAV